MRARANILRIEKNVGRLFDYISVRIHSGSANRRNVHVDHSERAPSSELQSARGNDADARRKTGLVVVCTDEVRLSNISPS